MSLSKDKLLKCINEINEIKNTDFMKELKINNQIEYESILAKTFPLFKQNYEAIFKKICDDDDLDFLYYMINMKDKIDNGSNKKEIEKEIALKLSNKYVKK